MFGGGSEPQTQIRFGEVLQPHLLGAPRLLSSRNSRRPYHGSESPMAFSTSSLILISKPLRPIAPCCEVALTQLGHLGCHPQLAAQHGWRMKKHIIVGPPFKKRFNVVRGATNEDIEAEKEFIEEDALERMEKTLESVKSNFNTVRTGRASPALLDRIEVEYYGSLVSLKSMAQVSTPEGSTLLIQPFDKSSLSSVEKAISKSDIGLTPSNDGNAIRLYIPPLTEERRKDMLKMVSKLSEEGKIAIRNIRRDAIKSYEKLEKEKKLSTDNVKDLSSSMQKLTDGYVKKMDTLLKQKEKELLTV